LETIVTSDHRNTLNLPETDFPMKANLPVREPEQIKLWDSTKTYQAIQEHNRSKPTFAMPDGPPYANASIHLGHALNKILKDFIVKYKSISGFRAGFIPGWDCHGLPIEHAVAKELGNKRREKSDSEIRQLCRAYAEKQILIQREQFRRLGILADWEHPYKTMDKDYEAAIIRALADFFDCGYVYRGEKPVYWCWSDGTALADAEIEYADRKDPSVYVKFELVKHLEKLGNPKEKTFVVIWTTTPWTLPANLAISLNPEFDYGLYDVDGENWLLAKDLAAGFFKLVGKTSKLKKTFKGSDLGGVKKADENFDGLVAKHPFIDRPSYLLLGGHVTLEAGTGAVHTAPGHGQEDFIVAQKYGLAPYNPVDDWGKFTSLVPEYKGIRVLDANPQIVQRLKDSGHLILEQIIDHSFPHCWRCHNPVIFRATPQWFVAMDKEGKHGQIRKTALEQIKKVKWVPGWSENRITAMVENRPDWCISRQRLWGVPIPVFYCEKCGEAHAKPETMRNVAKKVEKEGLESWYTSTIEEFDSKAKCVCGHTKFRQGKDILDVWFESGTCPSAIQETRDGLTNPADIYIEGSDQHRGWFQSCLLGNVAIRGTAPYRAVVTHGFVNDAQGRKMSKSLGNVIDPNKFIEKSGAEILRLWVSYEDYSNDLAAGQESFDRVTESYRRIRNTCRYILSNLNDFDVKKDSVPYKDLQDVDKWALSRLATYIEACRNGYESYEFHKIYHATQNYCTVDLSAIYLDILKDRLYTAKKTGVSRRAAQTVIYEIAHNLTIVLAPILSFLSEEVHLSLTRGAGKSVFIHDFPTPEKEWSNTALEESWKTIFEGRSVVTKQLEEARKEKMIGSGLEAKVILTVPEKDRAVYDKKIKELPFIFIVSQVELKSGQSYEAKVLKADGTKCDRCWTYSPKTNANPKFPGVCDKCVEALS
jgi:isoleucyl-tRNA synthetase